MYAPIFNGKENASLCTLASEQRKRDYLSTGQSPFIRSGIFAKKSNQELNISIASVLLVSTIIISPFISPLNYHGIINLLHNVNIMLQAIL